MTVSEILLFTKQVILGPFCVTGVARLAGVGDVSEKTKNRPLVLLFGTKRWKECSLRVSRRPNCSAFVP